MTADLAASPTPYQLLPRLTDEEYQALKADIAANGIRVPIDVDEAGVVLDGHHRAWIAADLGVECPRRIVAHLSDEQKRAHAIAANVYRRSLTREQRQQLIRRLRAEGMSTRQIADVAGIPRSTVDRDVEPESPTVPSGTVGELRRVTGTNGKSYPRSIPSGQTLSQRRDAARQLRDGGQTHRQIAEALGVAEQTIRNDLKVVDEPVPLTKSPADTPQKLDRIRDLANKGWTSRQIARDMGLSEERVRRLARGNDIDVNADKVTRGSRRIVSDDVVDNIVATLSDLAVPLRLVNFDDLDAARTEEWANSLTESIRALNRFAKQIKELAL